MSGTPITEAQPDQYRAMFDTAVEPMVLASADGTVVHVNPSFTALFGYTAADLRALGTGVLLDDTDPRVRAAMDERALSGRFRRELTMRGKDGSRLDVELSSVQFPGAGGTSWVSFVIHHVSEGTGLQASRARLLKALEAERAWLRAVLEHVPLGLFLFDAKGAISFNAKTEDILGMSLSPELGTSQYIDRIRHPDGKPVNEEELLSTRVLRSGHVINGEEFLVERDTGPPLPVLASAAPIRNESGAIIGGIVMLQDISERVRKEEAIVAKERLLDAIFELLPVGVWIADHEGTIVRGNPAGIRIWCGARYVDPSRFSEYKAWWVETGKRIEPEEWALARALRDGQTSIGELIRIQCFDGTCKTILNSALPLYDDKGRFSGAIAVNEDITRVKEAEAELQRALAARDRILGVVAHDLRTPLNVIQMRLHTLMRSGDRRADTADAVAVIQRQVRRMTRLLEDLLDAASVEQGALHLERRPIACGPLLKEVASAHEGIAREQGIDLRTELDASVPAVYADHGRLVQVLNNLIGNALKFAGSGAVVTVGATSGAQSAVMWVADTGPGIAASDMPHIFDPLWQAKPDRRGIGLGLPIAKAIVENHGGRIWAESETGRGTRFFFTIPAAADAPAPDGAETGSELVGGRPAASSAPLDTSPAMRPEQRATAAALAKGERRRDRRRS